jgi:hypothetical protein
LSTSIARDPRDLTDSKRTESFDGDRMVGPAAYRHGLGRSRRAARRRPKKSAPAERRPPARDPGGSPDRGTAFAGEVNAEVVVLVARGEIEVRIEGRSSTMSSWNSPEARGLALVPANSGRSGNSSAAKSPPESVLVMASEKAHGRRRIGSVNGARLDGSGPHRTHRRKMRSQRGVLHGHR